jgi:6-phosphogluconolactonase (cycloisomerase 2 family)
MADITNQLQAAAGVGGGGLQYIATAQNQTTAGVQLFDVNTPGIISLAASYTTTLRAPFVVNFSPDGKYLAVGIRQNNSANPLVVLLDHTTPGTLTLAATYSGIDKQCQDVEFTPNGNYLACSVQDTGIQLLNHTTPGSLSTSGSYSVPSGTFDISWNSDGSYLATIAQESSLSTVTILNHTTPGTLTYATRYLSSSVTARGGVSFSPDDQYIAANFSSTVRLLSFTAPSSISSVATYTLANTSSLRLSFTQSGNYLGVGNGIANGITVLNHTTPGSLSLSTTYNRGVSTPYIAWNYDGTYLVGGGSTSITLFDFSTPGTLTFVASYTTATTLLDVTFSPPI